MHYVEKDGRLIFIEDVSTTEENTLLPFIADEKRYVSRGG